MDGVKGARRQNRRKIRTGETQKENVAMRCLESSLNRGGMEIEQRTSDRKRGENNKGKTKSGGGRVFWETGSTRIAGAVGELRTGVRRDVGSRDEVRRKRRQKRQQMCSWR